MTLIQRCGALVLLLALVTGCCDDDGDTVDQQSSSGGAPTTAPSATPTAAAEEEAKSEIVKSGFGQRDEYAWVTALVRNGADEGGQTVTVQFNVKDSAGAILVSESQVESFSRGGELLAVGTQVTVPGGAKVASIDATLVVEEDGIGEPFPEIPVGPVTVGVNEYDEPSVTFEITNPTQLPMESPRIGIICMDAAGAVIGGGSEYPDLVPPGGKARVDADVLTSGKPAKCEVYAGGPTF